MTVVLVVALMLMAAGDCVTTHVALERGARELNPVLGSHPSTLKVVLVHVLALAVLFTSAYFAPRAHAVHVLAAGALIYGIVTALNIRTINRMRKAGP